MKNHDNLLGRKLTFNCSDEGIYRNVNDGKCCTVIEEVGAFSHTNIWKVEFEDGSRILAFTEELLGN